MSIVPSVNFSKTSGCFSPLIFCSSLAMSGWSGSSSCSFFSYSFSFFFSLIFLMSLFHSFSKNFCSFRSLITLSTSIFGFCAFSSSNSVSDYVVFPFVFEFEESRFFKTFCFFELSYNFIWVMSERVRLLPIYLGPFADEWSFFNYLVRVWIFAALASRSCLSKLTGL